jgi:hypothetical protein
LISRYGILEMPAQDSIKGWHWGCDGESFIVEVSTAAYYDFRSYWTPSAFTDVPEASTMVKFFDEVNALLGKEVIWDKFFNSLPGRRCYRRGSLVIVCKNVNLEKAKKKQAKYYEKKGD